MASGIFLSIFESYQAVVEWQEGDRDAAIGRIGMATGGMLFAAGAFGEVIQAAESIEAAGAITARLASLARFVPYLRVAGWVGAGLIIVSLIYTLCSDDNPLEAWLAHCFWGKDAYSGKGKITNREGKKETVEYGTWKQNSDNEITCALHLVVGFRTEANWTDWQSIIRSVGDTPLNHRPEKFKLRVIVPPFRKSKVVLKLRFMDSQYIWNTLIDENKSGKAWYSKSILTVQGQTTTGGPQPIIHTWEIDEKELPPGAVQAEARICFDPYGNGKHLLPNNSGLLLTTIKGNQSSESSN